VNRRIAAAITGGIVVFVGTFLLDLAPSQAQVAPSRPVDRDLNSYVVFGFQTVDIKGSNDADKGFVRGGNIGANGTVGTSNDATVNICANGDLKMSDGSQVVGDRVRFSQQCFFWDLFANEIVGEGGGTAHSITQPVGAFPIVTDIPPFPSFTCTPGNDVTVTTATQPFTLPPGSYGDIRFQDGTTVTLQPGLYQMCNFRTGQNVHTITQQGTVMQVVGEFDLRNGNRFGEESACGTYVHVAASGLGANANSVNFGKQGTVAGHFYSQGRIALGHSTILYGTFWGSHINSDWGLNIEYCPPLGEFPITKAIIGPGAGSQGEIRFEITCVPNPPNTTPIPPFVIPPGATGVQSTVVTGITIPATCSVREVTTGDNDNVDVIVVEPAPSSGLPRGAPAVAPLQVPLCPDFGIANPDPLTRTPRDLPGFDFIDIVETTSTSSTSTTTTSTTSTTVPPDPPPTTTTATTSTTTSTTTTTTPPTLAPTTTIACVLPPVTTIGPEIDPTTTVAPIAPTIPGTGASGSDDGLVIALAATALGGALVVIARRRRPGEQTGS
jgi:hypothetical protein